MPSVEEWYKGLPPVTRNYFTIAMGTTVVCSLGALDAKWIYLDYNLIFKKFEIWRLASNVAFFGNFGISTMIQLYLLVTYVGHTETKVFERSNRGIADFLFMLLFVTLLMLLGNYILGLGLFFLGSPLVFSCIHVFCRSDPYRIIKLYGFDLQAWKFPFILCVVQMLMGGSIMSNIVGIVCGHVYFFFTKVIPVKYGRHFLATPEFLYRLCDSQNNAHQGWQRGAGGRLN
jgi:Derlin-2/3